MSLFIPSIESSSSNEKLNFCRKLSINALVFRGKQISAYSLADRLVSRIVPHLQIRVVQRSLTTNSLGWVKAKHLLQEVNGEWVGVRVECSERHARLNWQRADVVLCLSG